MTSKQRVVVRRFLMISGILLLVWNFIAFFRYLAFPRYTQVTSWRETPSKEGKFQESWNKTNRNFWESIQPQVKCKEGYLQRLGKFDDGGKWVCGLEKIGKQKKPCSMFSFGVNDESSFEADILLNTGCRVYAFDPVSEEIGYPLSSRNPRVIFQRGAVGGDDGNNTRTLKTLMKTFEVEWIDILKIDIEGGEYETLSRMLDDFPGMPVGQLLVEFHFNMTRFQIRDGSSETRMDSTVIPFLEELERRGMSLFSKEANRGAVDCCWEFSFVNVNLYRDLLKVPNNP